MSFNTKKMHNKMLIFNIRQKYKYCLPVTISNSFTALQGGGVALTAVNIKIMVFWGVMSRSYISTIVSKGHAGSISRIEV
jgi:hypothetical protein